MIQLNEHILGNDRFPDGTLLTKLPFSPKPPNEIRCHYENDAELSFHPDDGKARQNPRQLYGASQYQQQKASGQSHAHDRRSLRRGLRNGELRAVLQQASFGKAREIDLDNG